MAINKRVAAAMKKVAKPKRKKTWADSQSAPQSKVYKAANDKAVLAKPVGFRWTDLGAARLGKNASVKPSAADIEKYKGKTFSKGTKEVDVNNILILQSDGDSELILGKEALVIKDDVEFSHILALSKALKIPSIFATGEFQLPMEGKVKFYAYNEEAWITKIDCRE